jgi:hypothetical protein
VIKVQLKLIKLTKFMENNLILITKILKINKIISTLANNYKNNNYKLIIINNLIQINSLKIHNMILQMTLNPIK